MRRWRIPLVLALAIAAGAIVASRAALGDPVDKPAQPPALESGRTTSFAVERIADGLNRPTWVGTAPGDAGALWVVEQPGRVVRLADGRREVAIDLTAETLTGAEQGLLGLAFHPDFAANGRLYVHGSDTRGDTRVIEFGRGDGGRFAVRRELLHVDQPEPNHNGGQLAFGPDGRLYLGLGDGGGAFDPDEHAQDPQSLLGKIVALDVDRPGARWAPVLTGLRNPWRFSFDAALGEIWIGDVGQDDFEEVNRVLLEPHEPPKNLGWSVYEGAGAVGKGHDLDREGELVWPVAGYTHADGCSITGGLVYRGTRLPRLTGRYLYGDFCTGVLWSLRALPGEGAEDVRREAAAVPQLTHIGSDENGELLLASAAGAIYRAVAPTGSGS